MTRARLLTSSLIAGIAVLAAVISWQTGSRPVATAVDRVAGELALPSALDAPAAAFDMAGLETYDEIIARPLFTQTRRPPAPETAETKKQAKSEPLPDWKLVGTAITTERQAALVWDTRNRRFVRLEPGMKQGSWEIAAVQPEVIVMSNGKVQREIKLPRF